jgi:Cu-Zn family superoxide dismutase
MKKISISILAIALIVFIGCKDEKKDMENETENMEETMNEEPQEIEMKEVNFVLESKSDSKATGKVSFTEESGMVRLNANFMGLAPGTHAIHIHEKADCSAADASSSGGHWNPTFKDHGKWGDEKGYHRGDIGNFEADDAGNGSISMQTSEWCLGCDDDTKNILGKAIIVHQGADDFVSQPSGDAGARVSCGGIIQ